MSPSVPKPPVSEKKPRKRLVPKTRLLTKTPIRKVNKARLDKRTKRYKAYMASTAWKLKRMACLTRDNWTCQECGWRDKDACLLSELIAPRQLHAAHLSYARFGNENLEDLVTKCADCHLNKEHAMSAIKPRFKRAS